MFIIQISSETGTSDTFMTTRLTKNITSTPAVYQALLKQVKKTLLEGQARIEQERVRTYWETGRIIHTYILKYERAQRGQEVIKNLSKDLGVSDTVLHRCVKFVQKYPDQRKVAGRPLFSWSHYRKLIAIPDDKERILIEEKAGRNGWSAEELEARVKIRQVNNVLSEKETPPPQTLLTPARGQLYTYRFVSRPVLGDNPEGRELLLDLGFGVFKDMDARVAARFEDQQIVESRLKDGQYTFTGWERNPKDLFTYKAYIEKVIDGDTLKVRIDQGFDIWNRQVLRLRDIDCPEVGTKEGDAAKNFVRSLLKEASLIVLRSSRSDKYDRYLTDIFIPQGKESDPEVDVYLNNLLLEKGYALRV